MALLDIIDAKLSVRRNLNSLRSLKERQHPIYIDFSSNDYLCLASNQYVIEKSVEFINRYGAGAKSARLLSDSNIYSILEEKIAGAKGYEAALLFSSGYQANISCVSALLEAFDPKDTELFTDRLNHASIQNGIKLAGFRQTRYRNADIDKLEFLLERSVAKHKIIITESVFSMDGTVVDIDKLCNLKKRYNAVLYVDEAHAFGVFGKHGFGLCCGRGDEVDIAMGTLSKAVGSQGGYVSTNRVMRDYFVNFASGFVYSTALNPASIGASIAAIELIPNLDLERVKLQEKAAYLRQKLKSIGYKTLGDSQIVPIILESNKAADAIEEGLMQKGIYTPKIKYPTVPKDAPRIRISLNVNHKIDEIDELIGVLARHG